MSLNLDFSDTSDVSDEAIQWALTAGGSGFSVNNVRKYAKDRDYITCKMAVLIARLMQQHYPELLVDPDVLHVREACAKMWEESAYPIAAREYRKGVYDGQMSFKVALALYKEGKAARTLF